MKRESNPLQIVVEIDIAALAAQISEQITVFHPLSNSAPHYVTKKRAIADLGWSEYHLTKGEKEGFLKPLRLAGKGEIRYSFAELSEYHNQLQLQKHGIIQSHRTTETSRTGRNAPASGKRSRPGNGRV